MPCAYSGLRPAASAPVRLTFWPQQGSRKPGDSEGRDSRSRPARPSSTTKGLPGPARWDGRVCRWPASPPAAASPLTRKGGGRPLLPVQGARGARACVDGLQAGAHSPEVPDCLAVRTRRTVWGREGSASPGASLKRCPDRSPHGRGAWLRPPRSAWTPRSRGGDAGDSFPPGDSAASSAGPAPQAPHKLGRGWLGPWAVCSQGSLRGSTRQRPDPGAGAHRLAPWWLLL